MNDKLNKRDEEIVIDIGRIFHAVMDKSWLVAITALACAVVTLIGTVLFVSPKYQSSAMFYVNNNNLSLGDTSVSISSGDLLTSRNLVDSYIVILNTRETLTDVAEFAGASRSYREIREMISSEAVNETEIFKVTVTSTDPQEAEKLANAIAYILPKRIGTIIDGTSAKVVDSAVVPSGPSSPSYTKNTVIGFLMGFLLCVGTIALREIFDTTICVEEDVNQVCKHPILAAVPDMASVGKGGSYYGYGSNRSKKGKQASAAQQTKRGIMGPNISFAASEAYKLLRTKLQFSFTDENDCRVIGLTSALSGEGKSLTAVNLAYTLSQLDKKVLLVDCDMRRPTLAEKMNLSKQPGLSSYLTRQSKLDELVQICEMKNAESSFHVITAGQNPPNPVELLSSERMKMALNAMRKVYDYVILDMPPIGEVSDALAIANETDGMLLVVRQNYCERNILADTVRQIDFIHAKTLGVVFNCTNDHEGNYGKGYYKRYYKRYGKHYYRGYARSYENNDRKVAGGVSSKKQ